MRNPGYALGSVDASRPHFDVVHSLFKQTVARIGREGDGLAVQFLLADDPQADKARRAVISDLEAKLERLSPQSRSLDDLLRLLTESCCHPSNMYTEVHWFPVDPE